MLNFIRLKKIRKVAVCLLPGWKTESVMIMRAFLSACVLLAVSLATDPVVSTVAAAATRAAGHGASLSGSTSKPKAAETRPAGNFTLTSLDLDGSMIQRALYVLIGITIIGVFYFLVRAVRLKKTTTQRKKYGLLSNYDDTVEMAQLESDDEEDTTVYEAKSLRR